MDMYDDAMFEGSCWLRRGSKRDRLRELGSISVFRLWAQGMRCGIHVSSGMDVRPWHRHS